MQLEVQPHPEPIPVRRAVVDPVEWRPALSVLGAVALLGLPLGALWSLLAPPEFVARSPQAGAPNGVLPFVGQSEHRFDDMAIFLLLGLAAGVLTGAALWLFRWLRGPVVLLAGVLGSLIAAWLAMHTGLWLVATRYPDLSGNPAPFLRPPVLQSGWVIVGQPFALAVTYSIITAWNRSDDLGSRD